MDQFKYLGRKVKHVPGVGWRVKSTGEVGKTRSEAKELIARRAFPYKYTGIPVGSAPA